MVGHASCDPHTPGPLRSRDCHVISSPQLSSSPPSLESYQTYLDHVKKAKEDPMFINTLYQRAVADHCLVVDLWKDYLAYLVALCLYNCIMNCIMLAMHFWRASVRSLIFRTYLE